MKTPFRQQVSQYDCVPTTFINAISFLFQRDEIPPLVIQRIYLYSLDSLTSPIYMAHGTSSFAVQLLGNWLNCYKHNKFKVITEYCTIETVHFRKGNNLSKCLNRKGVVLMRVSNGKYWHYILALEIKDGWLYCYDPLARKKGNQQNEFEFLDENRLHSPNIRINTNWLDTNYNKNKYQLGTKTERECLLFERV